MRAARRATFVYLAQPGVTNLRIGTCRMRHNHNRADCPATTTDSTALTQDDGSLATVTDTLIVTVVLRGDRTRCSFDPRFFAWERC